MSLSLKENKLRIFFYFILFVVLVIADQGTKLWSQKNFLVSAGLSNIHDYQPSSLPIFHIGQTNWLDFSLTYVRNTGAAWGFLGNLPETIRPYFFYVLTAVAMLFILYFFVKTERKNLLMQVAFVLIFSGAVGNYIDRVRLHYVIDWLHFQWNLFSWQYDYPVFNVADCCVSVGVFFLILDLFKQEIQQWKLKLQKKKQQ